jgi:hypothetical protein
MRSVMLYPVSYVGTGCGRCRGSRALGGMVAVGVIGLKWHYFTDTVAGAAVGIGTVCGLALLLDLPAISWLLALASRLLPSAVRRGIGHGSAEGGPGPTGGRVRAGEASRG